MDPNEIAENWSMEWDPVNACQYYFNSVTENSQPQRPACFPDTDSDEDSETAEETQPIHDAPYVMSANVSEEEGHMQQGHHEDKDNLNEDCDLKVLAFNNNSDQLDRSERQDARNQVENRRAVVVKEEQEQEQEEEEEEEDSIAVKEEDGDQIIRESAIDEEETWQRGVEEGEEEDEVVEQVGLEEDQRVVKEFGKKREDEEEKKEEVGRTDVDVLKDDELVEKEEDVVEVKVEQEANRKSVEEGEGLRLATEEEAEVGGAEGVTQENADELEVVTNEAPRQSNHLPNDSITNPLNVACEINADVVLQNVEYDMEGQGKDSDVSGTSNSREDSDDGEVFEKPSGCSACTIS